MRKLIITITMLLGVAYGQTFTTVKYKDTLLCTICPNTAFRPGYTVDFKNDEGQIIQFTLITIKEKYENARRANGGFFPEKNIFDAYNVFFRIDDSTMFSKLHEFKIYKK